jgi:hypothetical protein
MRPFGVLLLVLSTLVLSADAVGKGPISARVCGANGCQELEDVQASRELTTPLFRAQGRPDSPPASSSGWFDITMRFGDFPERFALLQDPAYIRAVGKREGIVAPGEQAGVYGWLRLTPAEAEAHELLTSGLEPLPIAELPHLRATAPELADAVRAAPTDDEGMSVSLWLTLGALGVLLGCVAFLFLRRRSRPSLKPAL